MRDIKTKKKWVHFIGMCGVTMAPTAKMLQDKGFFVTGSDKGIFPPISTYIRDNNLKLELGFKEEHLQRGYYQKKYNLNFLIPNNPDFLVVGNYIGPSNVEFRYAKSNRILFKSFPEVLKEYVIADKSIVVAGTYGKTTTTAILSWILENAGFNPNYMIGGIPRNFKHGIRSSDSEWSVVEGDEYSASRWDNKSKFFYYSPRYLVLTSAAWDHTDLFKTEEDYIANMVSLAKTVPEDGTILFCMNGRNIDKILDKIQQVKGPKIVTYSTSFGKGHRYGTENDSNYFSRNLKISGPSTTFDFVYQGKHEKLETKLLGEFNYENMTGGIAMALELGISMEVIKKSISSFKGVKRRLEIVYDKGDKIIIDDFAATPPKVQGSLSALRRHFPKKHITVIFEPNTGNRTKQALPLYNNIFNEANRVIIPRLRHTKTKMGETRIDGRELMEYISNTHHNVDYIPDDAKLLDTLTRETGIIVFMGSGGFRNMIQDLSKLLK